jgi:hypothetical protein
LVPTSTITAKINGTKPCWREFDRKTLSGPLLQVAPKPLATFLRMSRYVAGARSASGRDGI